MTGAERRQADGLNRYLDGLAGSKTSRLAPRPAEIDPALASAALALRVHDDAPGADSAFADRLLTEILTNAGHLRSRPQLPAQAPAIARPPSFKQGVPPGLSGPRRRPFPLWTVAHFATAALLVLTIASSFVFFGPARQRWVKEAPGISLTGYPDPAINGEAAALLWESRGDSKRPLDNPGHLTVDPRGNVWVTDPVNDGFQILSPDGTLLEQWGSGGTGPGQFNLDVDGLPIGAAAFDGAGNLYVADAGNQRIQKFGPDRSFILAWGEEGTGDGQFLLPDNLALDAQGRVYVLDGRRDDIQVFDEDGIYLRTIGSYGIGVGQFLFFDNGGLAVDRDDNLWVADISNNRIQKFSPEGAFLASIGEYGFSEGKFASPNGIAVDDTGRVLVVDVAKTGTRVQVFSSDGAYQGAWNESGGRMADLSTITSLALDGSGHIYVADFDDDRILKLRLSPSLVPAEPMTAATLEWQATGSDDQPLDHPAALGIDPEGRIWVADTYHHGYQILSVEGIHFESWGSQGSEPGAFQFLPEAVSSVLPHGSCPAGGIDFAPDGGFYVADSGNARVQKFGPDRAPLFSWGSEGVGDGQFIWPSGVAIAPDGRVAVADTGRNDVQLFSAEGEFLLTIGQFGTGEGELYLWCGAYLTFDHEGSLWVSDTANNRLQKFAADGSLVATIGKAGTTNGQFSGLGQIALDGAGRLFVADGTNRRVQMFDRDGRFLDSIGDDGLGAVYYPAGLALDGAGNLYVSDFFEDRLLKFRLPPSLTPERMKP